MKSFLLALLVIAVAGLIASETPAGEPLHQVIDQLVREKHPADPVAVLTDDAEFLRRVWLDLAGQIPTADELRAFLADPSPDKRTAMIDRLLSAPTWPQRMADLFQVILMERRGGDDIAWREWLATAFQQNRHWDQLVFEILNPNADDEANRAAAWFTTKRLENYGQNPIDYPGLVRDVGRLFLGVDLQCAECHDHLFIKDYQQVDFKGLFTVYQNTYVRRDVQFPAVGEKPLTAKLEFISVFDPAQKMTGPRIPFGKEIEIPEQPGVAALFKNPKTAPPRPEWSPLEAVARDLTRKDNDLFARNAVNRFWFALLGRGFVWPLDANHSENPPSHPELLDALTAAFVASDFDIKFLIREIALSETYQRTSRRPEPVASAADLPKPETFLVASEKRLSAEQLLASVLMATGTRYEEPADDSLPSRDDLLKAFIDAFANDAREPEDEFSATVKGALFWRNADLIQKLLARRPGNLLDRLAKNSDPDSAINELYLSVLSRVPSAAEQATLTEFMARYDSRETALQDAVWALLTSVEFYANH